MSEETTYYIGKFKVLSMVEDGASAIVMFENFDGEVEEGKGIRMPLATYHKIKSEEAIESLGNINDLIISSAVLDILALLGSEDYNLSLVQVESVARSIQISVENKEKQFFAEHFKAKHPKLVLLSELEKALDELA